MKIAKIRDVKTPTRGTELSAGIDFYIPNDSPIYHIRPHSNITIGSGIKVKVPKGFALIAFNKSSIASKYGLTIGACVVDEDYQGEIHLNLINTTNLFRIVSPGDKIAQFLLIEQFYDTIEEVLEENLFEEVSGRGEGGFGSTGS